MCLIFVDTHRWPVWRRLLVPADFKLSQLHDVLQIAMGWKNLHLHEFHIGERTFGRPDWENALSGHPSLEDERKVRLQTLFPASGAKGTYVYDFGDNWEHEIIAEESLPRVPGQIYPSCLAGQGQCPPEDCGGIPGYEHLARIMQDRYHPEYRALRRWLGRKFDPDEFSLEIINGDLPALQRKGGPQPRRVQKST